MFTGQAIDRRNPSSSFLAAKIVVFQAGPARRPCGLVAREKIFLTLCVSVFFHGKPCRRPPKNKQEEAQEIRMPTRVGHV